MSLFDWIGSIFKPATELVDDLVFSGEEKAQWEAKQAELRNKLAEIEAKVATRTLELQSQLIEANAKVAIAEQQSGNWLSKSWRPISSLVFVGLLVGMGLGVIAYNQFLAGIAGGFLGIYVPLRTQEKLRK